MLCRQEFCVYNEDGECILDEIEINATGMCGCCIMVSIDEKTLDKAKNQQLSRYREQESRW